MEGEGSDILRVTTPIGDLAWQVTGYAEVRSLLADPRLGRSHRDPQSASRLSASAVFGQARANPETEHAEHVRMRRLLTQSFSARRMQRLRPRITAIAAMLLDDLASMSCPADFHEAVSFPLPALVISELLGAPSEERDDFRRWSEDAAHMSDGERSRAGLASLFRYMRNLVEHKRRHPAEDVITDLVAAAGRDPFLSDDEVAKLAAGLLFAGHVTTVSAIDQGVVLLLTYPDQLLALRKHPDLLAPAVEEILRHPRKASPEQRDRVGGVPRYALTDLAIDGNPIPEGDLVLLSVENANRDAGAFSDPEKFDIGREINPHLTFGHGPHYCLGAPLARLELECLFGQLWERLPNLRLAVDQSELVRKSDVLVGGLAELPVIW
jgi:cytochrome P450